ncbi:MAG TPA: type VI secretion protein IcmF/TssM N-terminal domain-containing protein, partial [Acidobacteriota bacterium]|nr:type VI secretion protein IcmF/TssM N-terminal domain-containing protein [Acidobacteriota bacterium]
AKNLRSRIDELIVQLEILFPIYVVFTKCDLVAGFADYCGDYGIREREQVWGYTRRYEAAKTPLAEEFARETAALADILDRRRLRQLAAAVRPVQKRGTYLFPIEFGATVRRLTRFVEILFAPNPYQQNPMVRGLYFNSGTQEGTPIAQVMAAMQRDFGLGRTAPPSTQTVTETKPYFIKDLFQKIIIPDQARVTPLSSAGRRRKIVRGLINLVQVAAAALLFLALFTSYTNNRRANENLGRLSREVAVALLAGGGFALDHLDTLNLLREALEQAERGPGLMRRWGLYSGAPVIAAARDTYFRKYNDLFLRPLDAELKTLLRNPPVLDTEAGINQFFQTATAYQMVTLHYDSISHNPFELKSAADSIWRPTVAVDDVSRLEWLLDGQCRYYMKHRADTAQRWMRLPPDQALLDEANRVMANFWTIDRLYRRIVNDANGELGYLSMLEIAPGTIRLEGGDVGRAFTREGWNDHLSERVDTMPREIKGNPVLKQAFEGLEDDQIREQLTRKYADEFRAVWRAFLDGVEIVRFANLTEAVEGLDELSQDNSPMITILKRVYAESRLDLNGKIKRSHEEEFVPLGRFLGEVALPEGTVPPHASYLEMMSTLPKTVEGERDQLQQSAKCALRLRSLRTAFDQAERKIERLITGPPIARSTAAFLVRPLTTARNAAYADVCACVNRVWDETVAKEFRAGLGDVYPFNRSSQTEASRSQVSMFFGTAGIFSFEESEAEPARQEGMSLAPEYEDAVRVANGIRRVMPGGNPSVTFTLRAKAEWMSGLRQTRFDFGGRAFEFTPGQDMTRDYSWPAAGNNDAHLSLVLVDQTLYATPKRYTGDWAIFRLFDESEFSNDVCSWEFPTRSGPTFTVRYSLTGDGADFIRSGHFSRFRCPNQVCR